MAAAQVGSTEGSAEIEEKFSGRMERFSGAGMALLPWTKHMLVVLWDQLRVLVQIIYYTFISVFQMFRFEVHVRITDDPSATPDPSDPFLCLFSEDTAADHTEALLNSLRGEELCCEGEGGLFLGHKHPSSSWSVGDWNIFVSSSDPHGSDEDRSGASCWSSEEDHSLEFDCDESKALWESLSRSNDPYDPFCFSACISTKECKGIWDAQSPKSNKTLWELQSSYPGCYSSVVEQNKMGPKGNSQTSNEDSGESCKIESACNQVLKGESEEFCEMKSKFENLNCDVCNPHLDEQESQSERSLKMSDFKSLSTKSLKTTEAKPESFTPVSEGNMFKDFSAKVQQMTGVIKDQSISSDLYSPVLDPETENVKESWETESKSSDICSQGLDQFCDQSDELWETESDSAEESRGLCEWGKTVPVGRFWESSDEESDEEEGEVQRKSLVVRSDSDCSWSSDDSNSSESLEQKEENALLWDMFTKNDPFNPLCFSATSNRVEGKKEEEEVWTGLSTREQDPFHPLNFTVLKRKEVDQRKERLKEECRKRKRGEKPQLSQRRFQRHTHPQVTVRHWTKTSASSNSSESNYSTTCPDPIQHKKVRFSDQVQVHIMRSWPFARQASRRGKWEELARDRERFKRRIQDIEKTVGPVLRSEHREKVLTWTKPDLHQA